MRTKRTPELETKIVNRLKAGMKKKDIERELKVGHRIVDNIYKEYGFNQRPVKASTHYPPGLLKEWDELHRRYGTCQK